MDWTLVVVYAVVGLALLVVLWPTTSGARRFLKRWGVPQPNEEQTQLAVRYLRNRRLLYPPLFLLSSLLLPDDGGAGIIVTVIAALLVAEAIGALRPVRGPRVASLTPRKWGDLVQRWAVALMIVLGVTATAMAVAGLLAQPWVNRVIGSMSPDGSWRSPDGVVTTTSAEFRAQLAQPVPLFVLLVVALGMIAVLGIVWLAVRRASVEDPQADAALRTRSARVAVGIGLAWMSSAVVVANNRLTFLRAVVAPEPPPQWLQYTSVTGLFGLLVLFVGAGGWYWVANPGNRMPYVQSTR